MFSLENRVALVTGASRGIGAGIARCLAEAGADVVINYLNSETKAIQVAEDIQKLGRRAVAVRADVRNADEVRVLFDTAVERLGRIDIFVNNSGISKREDIFETTPEQWDRIIETNLTSTFLCLKSAAEIMRRQHYGRIIINSSMVGSSGAHYGYVHYAASKGGQLAITKTLARTLAPYGITVNAVAPGPIITEMSTHQKDPARREELIKAIPAGRFGEVMDVAPAVVFLASDEARYITGATLDINGGMYMR